MGIYLLFIIILKNVRVVIFEMVKVTDTPLPKRLEGMGSAVSICAESNGRSTSGLKMEPKCIAIIQTTELGNPFALLWQVGQS